MKIETAERIKTFIKEMKEEKRENFTLFYHDEEIIVLQRENWMKLYLIKGKIYEEQIMIYPIFSISEIKEALTQF